MNLYNEEKVTKVSNKCALIEFRDESFIGANLVESYKSQLEKEGHLIIWLDRYSTLNTHYLLNKLIENDITHLLIFIGPNDIISDSLDLKLFRKNNIKSFIYFGDSTEYFFKHDLSLALLCDGVFVTSNTDAARFKDFGIDSEVVLSSFKKELYNLYPMTLFKRESYKPISFVGDIYKADRKQLISELQSKGIFIETYSNISHERMCEIFAKSFISLNFTKTHFSKKSLIHPLYQLKGRPTEIALANGFCLSEFEPTNQSTGNQLSMNRIYNSDDFYKYINFFLLNTSIRNELCLKATNYCNDNLNHISAVKKILNSLDKMNFNNIKLSKRKIILLSSKYIKNEVKEDFLDFLRLHKLEVKGQYFLYPLESFKGIILAIIREIKFIKNFKNAFIIDARGANYKPCGVKSFVIDQIKKSKKLNNKKVLVIGHDDNDLVYSLSNNKIQRLIISKYFSRFNLAGLLFELFIILAIKPRHWLSMHSFLPIWINCFNFKKSFVLHDTFALEDKEWWGRGLKAFIKKNFYSLIANKSLEKADQIYIDNKFILSNNKILFNKIKNKISIKLHGLPNIKSIKFYKEKENYKYQYIFIGNTRNYKNMKLLLKAWDAYNYKKNKLCIISNSITAKKIVKNKDIDLFIAPNINLKNQLISDSKYVVITSINEGVGLIAYEAILQNKFLILPDIELFKEKFSFTNQVTFFKSNSKVSLINVFKKLNKQNYMESDLNFQRKLKNKLELSESIIDYAIEKYFT